MQDNKRVILHIVSDTLFFDSLSDRFEELSGYTNIYLMRKLGTFTPKRIKRKDKLTFVQTKQERNSYLSKKEVDIIFFHGLFGDSITYYKYIPTDKIVIWWSYGIDLYEANKLVSPLLKISLYKKITGRSFPCFKRRFFTALSYIYGNFRGNRDRKKWIGRVDYCSTVFPIEYEMLNQLSFFSAEPFMLRGIRSYGKYEPVVKTNLGSIMLGHSATYTDNHLDIINIIDKSNLQNRKIIMPVNYGHNAWKSVLKKYRTIGGAEVFFLENVLPRNEYFELMQNCTHAIFGPIRQQAVGNIHACMRLGIKVFLYKDSMDYKQFKKDGYFIYTIEDNLTESELNKPLSEQEVKHNLSIFYSILGFNNEQEAKNNMQSQFDSLFK